MKNYKQLVKSLPSKTVVFAFGRFNPPTIGHELLVKAVKKLAENNKAAHAIYASKTQNSKKDPLPVDKKIQYLNLLFPNTNFVAASQDVPTFIQAAQQLNKHYKHLIMVAGSDRVPEYTKILNTYNGKEYNFDSIQVISAGDRDPDSDSASGMSATKMRAAASKGDFQDFKKGLPSHVRDIDAKRLMNDVRTGLGLEIIKEQVKFTVDEIREKYFQGEIFLEGQLVESSGDYYAIVKRGSNHLLLEDSNGNKVSKWIKDVSIVEDIVQGNIPNEISFNGYATKNLHHAEDARNAFIATIQRLGNSTHDQDILHALKATDTYMKLNDMHLAQGKPPTEKEFQQWREAHAEARNHLARMGEFMHHEDYWHNHEHELQLMAANYAKTGAEMNEELTNKTIKSSDKTKVARMIADFLGVENAEKNSSPETLVNLGLRKIKNKSLHAESISILHKMLSLADEVNISYDSNLVPQKMKEETTDRVVPINKKSKRNAGNDILSLKDFNRLNKPNIKEQAINPATGDVDTEDDTDELHIMDVDGREVAPQQIKHTKVGHSLASPHDDVNRRMKVRYKLGEESINEVSLEKAREVHGARVDQYNKAKKTGGDVEKAKSKMTKSFKHYLNKDKKETEKMFAKQPKDAESIKKSANAEYEYNKKRGWSNEEVEYELDEAKMKMTYREWLKQTGKTHSPENTELYKKTQTEDVYASDYKINPETGRKFHPNRINFKNSGMKDKLEPEDVKEEVKKKQIKTPVRDDSYQIGANNGKGFDAFFEEAEDDDFDEDDLDGIVDSIKDENDILDAYDDDELAIVDDEGQEIHSSLKEETLNEVLSRMERIKAKIRFARSEAKRERKIQIALKRRSDTKTLNNRARKLAVVTLKKRLAKKPLEKLTVGEKERIERIIEKRKQLIDRLAMKMVPKVRKIEQARLEHNKYTKA